MAARGDPDRRARSTTRCTRRSTPRSATSSSTPASGSGSPGTWRTSTPGRSTSPATSRRGDQFRVVLDRLVSEDGEVRFGRVLASDLTMSGKSLTAFRFERGGRSTFYDDAGKSLRRAFLRAPVQFRRISSSFARARRHPVLGITRRHEGTDYAASPGTPVMAAGDGVVLRAGRAGGYGNLIELRHRNGITTRYGHLRGFARGIRGGVRVSSRARPSATSGRPASPAGRTSTTSSG